MIILLTVIIAIVAILAAIYEAKTAKHYDEPVSGLILALGSIIIFFILILTAWPTKKNNHCSYAYAGWYLSC